MGREGLFENVTVEYSLKTWSQVCRAVGKASQIERTADTKREGKNKFDIFKNRQTTIFSSLQINVF